MARKIKIYVVASLILTNICVYSEVDKIKDVFIPISSVNIIDDCVGIGCW